MKQLIRSYMIIALIFILVVIIYFTTQSPDAKDFSLNLTTEIIGILITVLLIDYSIQLKDKKEKYKISLNAFRQFKRTIQNVMEMFMKIYKATCNDMPTNLDISYQELFSTEEFYKSIRMLDFFKEAPVVPNKDWADYISIEIKRFKNEMNSILDKYAFNLDSKLIIDIESINNSPILNIMIQASMIKEIDLSINHDRKYLDLLNDEERLKLIKDFLASMFGVLEYFQKITRETFELKNDIILWGEEVSPELSSGRFD